MWTKLVACKDLVEMKNKNNSNISIVALVIV